MDEIDLVVLGVPNDAHCQVVVDAAAAGKHIVLEKPMCLNLAEADRMLDACRKAKVKLMYAEELCFAQSVDAQQAPQLRELERADTLPRLE